jgi:hypothetical protein
MANEADTCRRLITPKLRNTIEKRKIGLEGNRWVLR